MEIRIEKYAPCHRQVWDDLISVSRNGTFLFYRGFMEYHADRFSDFSLIFYYKNKPVALLPGNAAENILYTHQGLTYGGLVLTDTATTNIVLNIFDALIQYLKTHNICRIIYKTIPHIYHQKPAEEDLYALFRYNARLVGRSISSCIYQENRSSYSTLRKRGVKKALNNNLTIKESESFEKFWNILTNNLSERFCVNPVHSLSEIELLKSRFTSEIRLFEVLHNNEVVAGCVIFETPYVAHVQYISASEDGKKYGALDLLFDYLITNTYRNKPYFEFGISTENNGIYLNEGLIHQKEGFGGRGIVYDTYLLEINETE